MIDEELFKILACPKCKTEVELKENRIVCKNPDCGLRYPIRDGIPIMLIDETEK